MTKLRLTLGATVLITLAGQVCAGTYEIVAARQFGTTRDADALGLTFALVLALGSEVSSWVVSLFIPHYVEADTRAGPAAAHQFLRATATALIIGVGGVMVVVSLFAAPMISLVAPQLVEGGSTARLLRLFAPLAMLLPIGTLLANRLQVGGQFIMASARPVFWYGCAVVTLVALGPWIGPAAVAIGMVAGLSIYCVVLAVTLRGVEIESGTPESPARRLRAVGRQLMPLALGSAANYLNVTVERSLAARLPEGNLAALTYAFRLLHVPVTLFVLNASTVIFPALATLAAQGNRQGLNDLVRRALHLALAFTALIAALAMALARPGVSVLLERGAFTATSSDLTATALTWYAPGLLGIGAAQVLLTRVYYAFRDVRRLVAIGVATIGLNIALMFVLTPWLGLRGLPASASASALFMLVLMIAGLRRRLPGLTLGHVLRSALPVILAGAAAYGAASLPIPGTALARVLGGGLAGVTAYMVVLMMLSPADARLILNLVVPSGRRDRV